MNWEQVKKAFDGSNMLFKRCDIYLVKLELCPDSVTNANRSSVCDPRFAKFRASHLKVIQILDTLSGKHVDSIVHTWHSVNQKSAIEYKVGCIVYPDFFDRDIDKICAPGIHYFKTLFAAYKYAESLFLDNGMVYGRSESYVKSYGFENLIVSDIF